VRRIGKHAVGRGFFLGCKKDHVKATISDKVGHKAGVFFTNRKRQQTGNTGEKRNGGWGEVLWGSDKSGVYQIGKKHERH